MLMDMSNYTQESDCTLLNVFIQKLGSNLASSSSLLVVDLVSIITILDVLSINLMDVPLVSKELPIEGNKCSRVKKSYWLLLLDFVVFHKVCSI